MYIKKYFSLAVFILILISIFMAGATGAQTITQAVQPQVTESSSNDKNIEILKDKIATKVAELQIKNKKVIAGFIDKKTNETIDLKDLEGKIMKIAIDESLTTAFDITAAKKEIELSDLVKNDYIVVSGSQLDNSINANAIYKDKRYVVASGKIIEVIKADFAIKVTSIEKDTFTLDIESSTKQLLMDAKTLKPAVSGFSKFKEGDTIHFVFEKPADSDKKVRFTASRTLIIPQEFFTK